jgi:hypothetical protein
MLLLAHLIDSIFSASFFVWLCLKFPRYPLRSRCIWLLVELLASPRCNARLLFRFARTARPPFIGSRTGMRDILVCGLFSTTHSYMASFHFSMTRRQGELPRIFCRCRISQDAAFCKAFARQSNEIIAIMADSTGRRKRRRNTRLGNGLHYSYRQRTPPALKSGNDRTSGHD